MTCADDSNSLSGKISAFSGIIVTLIDGVVIFLVSLALHTANRCFGSFDIGLYLVSVVYLIHAMLEWKYAIKYRIGCLTIHQDLEQKRNSNVSLSSI